MVNYCQKCGARIEADDLFCPDCGTKLVQVTQSKNPKTAAVLGFLFGPLGYIYVKRYGRVFLGFIGGFLLLAVTQGKAVFLLPLFFAFDCYRIAKKTN